MTDPFTAAGTRRIILTLLLGGLLVLAYAVLQLFPVPVAWAAIMAYTTWPLHLWLKRALGGRATLSAMLMTLLLTATFVDTQRVGQPARQLEVGTEQARHHAEHKEADDGVKAHKASPANQRST